MVTMRRAFTMLELIVAIVIIGIVSLTIPMILVNNARQVDNNLLQEAITVTATKMGQSLTYQWDENSMDPAVTTLAKTEVLDIIPPSDLELVRVANVLGSDFRIGHFVEKLHRRMTPLSNPRIATAAAALGPEGGDLDDIDDLMATAPVVATNVGQGYKNNYLILTGVGYVSDAATYSDQVINDFTFTTPTLAAPTNIKMIEIHVFREKDPVGYAGVFDEEVVVLRSYAANIGETDYYQRTY